jgi:hypothetical protein
MSDEQLTIKELMNFTHVQPYFPIAQVHCLGGLLKKIIKNHHTSMKIHSISWI